MITALVAVSLAPAAPSSATASKTNGHQKAACAARTKAGQAKTVALPTGFRPEGIAAGRGTSFYVGSVSNGRIWVGNVKNDKGRELVAPVTGRSLRGLLLDKRSGWLWAVGSEGTGGLVLAVSARTGAVKASIAVPDAVFLNDLTLSRGSLWVTDSAVDRLLKIQLDRRGKPVGGYSTLALTGAWPTPAGFRANGIVALRGGKLLLDNTTAGGLYTVNPRTGVAKAVPVIGTPAVSSGDGMVLRGNKLFVVRGVGLASVTELKLRATKAGLRAKVVRLLTDATLDVSSTAALIRGKLWVVNARFGVANPDTQPYWVTGLTLRRR
jgi:hypothetical protein